MCAWTGSRTSQHYMYTRSVFLRLCGEPCLCTLESTYRQLREGPPPHGVRADRLRHEPADGAVVLLGELYPEEASDRRAVYLVSINWSRYAAVPLGKKRRRKTIVELPAASTVAPSEHDWNLRSVRQVSVPSPLAPVSPVVAGRRAVIVVHTFDRVCTRRGARVRRYASRA
jgi:hypothetical protein